MQSPSDNHPNAPSFPDLLRCDAIAACGKREMRDEEYRRRIHSATRELLNEHGIDSITMYQIAQTAGIGQGTLYRRYAHVGEVCTDMLKSTTGQFLDSLDNVSTTAATPLAQLEETIERIIDYVDGKTALFAAISQQYAGKKSFLPHKQPIAQKLHALLSSMLQRAVDQGEAVPCDVPLTISALLSTLAPENYMYYRDTLGYDKDRYTAGLRRLFIDALRSAK
ncbi:MAG: TetR/AcrR family transcriptional regulator [Paenibacillaceae bacterium]|nr:TetR/AcrR family transcriptional regulator [Paenibacillaceae bacterium]